MFYMQARWFDPGSGRFLSVDPLIRSEAIPQSSNAYSYAENNPVNGVDPNGTQCFGCQGPSGRPFIWVMYGPDTTTIAENDHDPHGDSTGFPSGNPSTHLDEQRGAEGPDEQIEDELDPASRAAEIMNNEIAWLAMSRASTRARGFQRGDFKNSPTGVGVSTDGTDVEDLSSPDQVSFTDGHGDMARGLVRKTGSFGTSAFDGIGISIVLEPFRREGALRDPVTIQSAMDASATAHGAPVFVMSGRGRAVLIAEKGFAPVVLRGGFSR